MSGIVSPFQMERNKVVEFGIIQKDIADLESVEVSFGADYKISNLVFEDNNYSGNLDLLIKLDGITDKDEKLFEIQLDMLGVFKGDANFLAEEKFIEMLKINGVSTLMQLSRAYVTSITALSGFPKPIQFPMVNVFELNKMKENSNDEK